MSYFSGNLYKARLSPEMSDRIFHFISLALIDISPSLTADLTNADQTQFAPDYNEGITPTEPRVLSNFIYFGANRSSFVRVTNLIVMGVDALCLSVVLRLRYPLLLESLLLAPMSVSGGEYIQIVASDKAEAI